VAVYGDITELGRLLNVTNPNAAQTLALTRVLTVASGEVDAEIDLADDADALAGWQLALVEEVALERAVEHWQQGQSPFGIIGLGDGATAYSAKDSWNRHALKLAPLKNQWGLA
jgi:hypothetical protein